MRQSDIDGTRWRRQPFISIVTPDRRLNWAYVLILIALWPLPEVIRLGSQTCASADDAAPASDTAKPQADKVLPKAGEGGWRPLFDGKTLTNWKPTNFGGEGEVYVKDGVVGFHMGNPLTGITWDGAELPKVNYELAFETRRVEGGDFFCALTFPYKDSHASLVLGGWGGAVTGMSSINGYDASENETTDYFKFEKGKWYKVRLKVTDSAITAFIDDEQLFEVETADKTISTRIEVDVSKPLGFCSFETQGEVRNIRLREIKPDKD
jgi:hypothetical protein